MTDLFKEIEKSFTKIEKLFTESALSEFSNTSPYDLEKYNMTLGKV